MHAFEPNANLVKDIERHIRINNLTNVTLHPVGLGQSDEKATLKVFTASNSGSASFLDFEDFHQDGYEIESTIRHGDALIASLPPMRIAAIKMDVQGFEANVLLGLKETIIANRPALLIEIATGDVQTKLATSPDFDFLFQNATVFGFRTKGVMKRYRETVPMSRADIKTYTGDILITYNKKPVS